MLATGSAASATAPTYKPQPLTPFHPQSPSTRTRSLAARIRIRTSTTSTLTTITASRPRTTPPIRRRRDQTTTPPCIRASGVQLPQRHHDRLHPVAAYAAHAARRSAAAASPVAEGAARLAGRSAHWLCAGRRPRLGVQLHVDGVRPVGHVVRPSVCGATFSGRKMKYVVHCSSYWATTI